MDFFKHKLEEVLEKTEYLDQKTQNLVGENRRLKAALSGLEEKFNTQSEELNNLRQQYEIVRLAKNLESGAPDEKMEFLRNKVNEYIREIDQCLKLIGD